MLLNTLRKLIPCCLLVLPALLYGQSFQFKLQPEIPFISGADTLTNAWAGGLNAPQYSKLDVNNDSEEDLIVFDRSTSQLHVYTAERRGNGWAYQFNPIYQSLFPALKEWVLLADYDGDGRRDLFTSTEGGVKVYRNATTGGRLAWEMVSDLLYTTGFSGEINLYVSAGDIPAISDVDGDGDLDVLTADPTGHSVEFHRNMSQEKYAHRRNLEFVRETGCWGKFEISESCAGIHLNVDCGDHHSPGGRTAAGGRIKHTGVTLLATDLDANGTTDLLMGTVSCDKILMLTNGGTPEEALITAVATDYPAGRPAELAAFSASFYEDIDFDGKKDLLITPNVTTNEGNRINFRQSSWWYTNTGTAANPAFSFQQKDFLQNTMIDLGENSFPALADTDGDGDLDIVAGHRGIPVNGKLQASLYLFENIGTRQSPAFRLKTDDYLGLAAFGWSNLRPQFADLNGDRVPDLVLVNTFNDGLNTDIKYWLNTASRGRPFAFNPSASRTLPLNLRMGDTPLLYDLDGDGDADALMGRLFGELEYFQNTGTRANPAFRLVNPAFGGIPADPFDRSAAPLIADMDGNGKPDLLTGNRSGVLRIFPDITDDLNGFFSPAEDIIADSLSGQFMAIRLGGNLTLTAGDLNVDGMPDLVTGSTAGGLSVLKNLLPGGNVLPGTRQVRWFYPNPAGMFLYMNPPEDSEVSFYNSLGQPVGSVYQAAGRRETTIDLPDFPSGLYLVRIRNAGGTTTGKLIVNNR